MKRSPQTFPGDMLTDANKGIDAITYNRLHRPETVQVGGNTLGFIYDAAGNMLQRTYYHPMATLNPAGGATLLSLDLDPGTPSLQTGTDTLSYCGPFEYSNGALSRVNFPGGYVKGGVAYHYIHDHQGNVRQVVNVATGAVVQENHYYPGGMLFAESTSTYFKPGTSGNTYRYGGKEFLTSDGLNLSLHGARMYDPALLRFITPDPLRHETPHLPAYLYCAANPVMHADPTGLSTRVVDNGNGTYRVIGGALDSDLRIFLCATPRSESGIPIGVTPVETSFYNSDEGTWMVGAIIDANDNSGVNFINSMILDTPINASYAWNARGGRLYDFKVTNGTETREDDNKDHYRGMPIPVTIKPGFETFCSARDIGNMMAGYVAGYNAFNWKFTRVMFDVLQTYQDRNDNAKNTEKHKHSLFSRDRWLSREGVSSQNAQKFGYYWGRNRFKSKIKNTTPNIIPYNILIKVK